VGVLERHDGRGLNPSNELYEPIAVVLGVVMRNSLHPPVTRTEPLHIKLQTNPRVSKRTRVKRNSSRGRLARPRDTLRPRRFRTAPTCTQFRITPRIRRGPFQPQFTDSKILVVPAVGIEFRFTPSQTTIMAGCASPWSWQDANVTFLRCSSAAPAVALRPGSHFVPQYQIHGPWACPCTS
jgi:hypothetical protein